MARIWSDRFAQYTHLLLLYIRQIETAAAFGSCARWPSRIRWTLSHSFHRYLFTQSEGAWVIYYYSYAMHTRTRWKWLALVRWHNANKFQMGIGIYENEMNICLRVYSLIWHKMKKILSIHFFTPIHSNRIYSYSLCNIFFLSISWAMSFFEIYTEI